MQNPFEVIDNRLSGIEELLIEIKHGTYYATPTERERKDPTFKTLSLDEFCQETDMPKNTFYQKAAKGEIPGAFKAGRRWRVDFNEYLQACKAKAPKSEKAISDKVDNYLSE